MAAMGAGDHMPFLQGGAYSHRHSLLAHIGILEAGNETLLAQVSSPLLEPADERHRPVELDPLILVHVVICHWPALILDVLFGGWFRLGSQLLPQLSAGLTSSIKQTPSSGQDSDGALWAGGIGDAGVCCQERTVQCLRQGYVGGVVGGQIVTQGPDAAQETYDSETL